jgi:hypothetical protein
MTINSSHGFFTSSLDGAKWIASLHGRFTPWERAFGSIWVGDWVGPRTVLEILAKNLLFLSKIIHSPTDALFIKLGLKFYTRIRTNIAATCFGLRLSSGSLYWAWLKLSVAYPGIFFGEGGCSTNSFEDRERRSGGGSPLVRGSGGSCNLVQEISFHIVNFS